MADVKVDRCPKHKGFRFNGICRQYRDELATALAKDKLAELRGNR